MLFILFSILMPSTVNAQTWSQIDDFPATQRDDGTSFVIANKAYCGTGFQAGWIETKDFHVLNMNTDSWSTITSLPTDKERQYASGFSSETHGFIFGGLKSGNYLNDLWMYDPIANNWVEKTPLPDVGRRGAASFVINEYAYIVCGNTNTSDAINEVWAYNMSNDSWQQKNDFPFGSLYRASGASNENSGYVIFGKDENNELQNQLYEYDPTLDAWSLKSQFPGLGRMHSSLNLISNKLFIIAGKDSQDEYHNDLWSFNLHDSIWEALASIPSAERRGGMSFNNGTNLYYTTGIDAQNTRLKETWKCDKPLNLKVLNNGIGVTTYPNPAHDQLTLSIKNFNPNQEYQLTIVDNFGKVIHRQITQQNDSKINVLGLSSGVYFIRIQENDNLQVLKFVKN